MVMIDWKILVFIIVTAYLGGVVARIVITKRNENNDNDHKHPDDTITEKNGAK